MQQTWKRKHEQGEEVMQKHSAAQRMQNLPKRSNGAKARKPRVIKDTEVEELLKPKQSC